MALSAAYAVFDCMIFLQAVVSEKGPASELIRHVENNTIRLFISKEILAEVRDVLTRPRVLAKYPHISIESVDVFLGRLLKKATIVKSPAKHFEYPRDPKDEKYIDLAAEAQADYLVSHDRDLLDLMTGTDVESKEFRQKFRPLKVVSPDEFLKVVRELTEIREGQ